MQCVRHRIAGLAVVTWSKWRTRQDSNLFRSATAFREMGASIARPDSFLFVRHSILLSDI